MSNSSTPQPPSGYGTPVEGHSVHSPTPPAPVKQKPAPKPANVFSNDGSFLQRFQRTKREEEEKRKEKDALERKKHFEDRFKNRGKRRRPDSYLETDTPPEEDSSAKESPLKKSRPDQSLRNYGEQIKTLDGDTSPKDTGTGARPLVK